MMKRFDTTRPSSTLALVLVLAAVALPLGTGPARAGAFVFAGESNGTGAIAHPTGYTGSGGTVNVSVCIDPTSANAAAMEIPVRNAVRTWNMLIATSPNLIFDGGNNIPASAVDFESAALHEIGHCIGLAHPNLATESGLAGANRNFTKTTDGVNDMFDIGAGPDGTNGSADDARGDDVNLHWYVDADNDPCTATVGTSDNSTMSRGLGNLPAGDLFAANADRTVCNDLGFANTEAVMQQGQGNDEDQRALGGDDVRTLRLGMSGADEIQGTGDDYTINLTYAGMTNACDIPLDFDDSQTGFAVCQAEGAFFDGVHIEITDSDIFFNTGANWFFNDVLASEPPVCDAGGAYVVECEGTTTTVQLDASGSSDPEDGDDLTFEWTTDCPGGTFDDATSATPSLTLASTACETSCTVEVTATDTGNLGTDCDTTVTIQDTMAPTASCPSDVTIECDEPTDPSNTGMAMAGDVCDAAPQVSFTDKATPGACPQEMSIHRAWTATDHCGLTGDCGQMIEVVDTTAPAIDVSVMPDVLWPPNHHMWTITATITATDNCNDDPAVTLVSIVSDEPDNGIGDGDFPDDVQQAVFGTDDREFLLRAERQGTGDGRVYTITYQADDGCGNTTEATAEVRVPHDQSGNAFQGAGFAGDGTALLPEATEWELVIPSSAGFDAPSVQPASVYVGHHAGVQLPLEVRTGDVTGDGLADLVLTYDAAYTRWLQQAAAVPVGVHYRTAGGADYAVPDVFLLGGAAGEPLPGVPGPSVVTTTTSGGGGTATAGIDLDDR